MERKRKTLDDLKRVILSKSKINPNSGCREWTDPPQKNGYGKVFYYKKHLLPHRAIYCIEKGIMLSRWTFVCHSCDNRLCVNVEHLWHGTPKDNQVDMVQKGRAARNRIGTGKFSADQIRAIRALADEGALSQETIGKLFDASQQAISQIKSRRDYSWVK